MALSNDQGKSKIELSFKWDFSSRTSLEDETPISPNFNNYAVRLNSFHVLKNFDHYNETLAQLMSKLGFYFSFSAEEDNVVLCFHCGCTTPILLVEKGKSTKTHSDVSKEKEFNFTLYHHDHCQFIRKLSNEGWVARMKKSEDKQDLIDAMSFEEYAKMVREFSVKRRAEVKLTRSGEARKQTAG